MSHEATGSFSSYLTPRRQRHSCWHWLSCPWRGVFSSAHRRPFHSKKKAAVRTAMTRTPPATASSQPRS